MHTLAPDKPRIIGEEIEFWNTEQFKIFAFNESVEVVTGADNDDGHGVWGGRIYPDGSAIEAALPECTSIRGLLSSHFGAEGIVGDVALLLFGDKPQNLQQKRTRTLNGRTYADHENYLIGNSLSISEIAESLVTHLATRPVLTGPGMILSDNIQDGYRKPFILDQRPLDMPHRGTAYIQPSATNAGKKPFIKLNTEPFTRLYQTRRLEVVSGSQNMFAFPIAERFFVTSAILRLIEHGHYPDTLTLKNPYQAIHIAGGADGLHTKLELKNGKKLTAPQIQLALGTHALKYSEVEDERIMLALHCDIAADLCDDKFEKWGNYLEWLAKRNLLEGLADKYDAPLYSMGIIKNDFEWHSVNGAIQTALRAKNKVAMLPKAQDISAARIYPIDETRALARARLFTYGKYNNWTFTSVDWHEASTECGKYIAFNDAYSPDFTPV
jgi:hypothetical protein